LTNLGKHFFLQLAVDSVEDVNREVDSDNMSYAKKAMIRCGLALRLDGSWSVEQLFLHLQEIIAKHLQYFQGQEVPNFNREILKSFLIFYYFFPLIIGQQLGLLCCVFCCCYI